MPEGSDDKVRAEIQMDRDPQISGLTHYSIMVARPTPSHLADDYDSSGDSDLEHEPSYWDRNPRNGHSRGGNIASVEVHGAQEGIRPKLQKLGLHRQNQQVIHPPQMKSFDLNPQSGVSSKYKQRKRDKLSIKHEFKKDKSFARQYWSYIGQNWSDLKEDKKGKKKIECEDNEGKKSMQRKKEGKSVEQLKNTKASIKMPNCGKIKDNKEFSESNEGESENLDTDNKIEQKCMTHEYIDKTVFNNDMTKLTKDSLNEKQSVKISAHKNIENEQIAMLDKQKMKAIDVKNVEKMDQEKEATGDQKNKEEMKEEKARIQLKIKKEKEKDLEKQKILKAEIDALKAISQKEELVVDMEQGKNRQKTTDKLRLSLDNKILDSLDGLIDEEQTVQKQILDPQGYNESEKQDSGKDSPVRTVSTLYHTELYPVSSESTLIDEEVGCGDKGFSLGFEVKGKVDELVESEFSINFPNLESATKRWEQCHREAEECTSIDEHSFSFASECQTSADSLFSISSAGKEQWTVREYCPDFYRFHQDSNRQSYDLESLFMQYSCPEREAIWEQNKIRIQETVDPKSDKEIDFEANEEKFKKEERESHLRKEESMYDDETEKLDTAVGKRSDDDYEVVDDGNDDKGNDVDGNVVDYHQEVTDLMDGTKNIEEEIANNTGDNGESGCNVNIERDEEPYEIIDAEEKDVGEKESVKAEKILTATIEEDKEDKQIAVDALINVENAITLEESEDAPDTLEGLLNDTKADNNDIETGMAHCRGMSVDSRDNKKKSYSKRARKIEKKKKFLDQKTDIWKKMKRIPKPVLPKDKEIDKLAPRKNWNGRRYSFFGHDEGGRRCSTNTGGRGGNGGINDNSGGSSNSDQRNNGERSSRNRSNQNNRDRGNDDNNRNNSRSQDNSVYMVGAEIEDSHESTRDPEDVSAPPADFKGYKKKHTPLDNFDWLETLVRTIEENNGPVVDIFLCRLINGENLCLSERLDYPEELSHDALQCSVCLTVDSLLKHYAHCLSVFNNCGMCVKIFSLVCSHAADCVNDNSCVCDIRICKAVRDLTGSNIMSHMKTLWFQVRKKLARIIDDAEEDGVEQPIPPVEVRPARVSRVSGTFSGPLPSIPEGTPLSITSTSRSGSRVLRRKKSNLTNVEERQQSGVSEAEGSSASEAVNEAAGAQGVEDEEQNTEEVDSKHGLYSRPEIPDEADAIPTSSEEGSVESTGSGSTEGSGQFAAMTGASRFTSLPMGPPGHGEPYFPSFKDKPTGKKGIGEVVYAGKHQLVVVVSVWGKFKTQYLIEAKLAKHYTEEGVILIDFKNKLHIKGLRYQNEFQWIKVAHLGNGMTGKCHLAMDFETEFKFCVKEIHISNYEKEEIELWSELDHPNVVQVYGAIRHGEKIYILQEFIEGGCLTEAINVQRKLGRRLSQLTALRYFQELLEVLKYLKSRNILHEDLKADNILLNKSSEGVSIKVADFGLARRCQGFVRGGTKPVGTQTQWSPEKAEAREGYGFAAEIWAAVCVLVHMLSGQPPWIRRYESFKALIVVIVEKSPPVEDIPRNIHESIKDLIQRGFTVCQGQRPAAEEMLMHSAFRLLHEASGLQSTNGTYSILESIHFESSTNRIDVDPNADLRIIYRNLVGESASGPTAEDNGARRRERKVSSIVDVHGEDLPYYSNDYRIYTVGNGGRDGKKTKTEVLPAGQSIDDGSNKEGVEIKLGNAMVVDMNSLRRQPSHPDDNIDPMAHIDRFYNDLAGPTVLPEAHMNLVMYHPNLESIGSQKENSSSHESSIENLSSGNLRQKMIPKFEKILTTEGMGEGVLDIAVYTSDEEEVKEENILENFDFEKFVGHVQEKYNLPTVVNSSADLSPGSQFTSEQGSISPGTLTEMNENGQISKNLEIKESTLHSKSEMTKKELKTGEPSVYSGIGDDQLQSINDDDLFKSGSPPKFSPEIFSNPHGYGHFNTIQEIPEASNALQSGRNEEFHGGIGAAHQMFTPGRPRLDGASLPPSFEHVPKINKPSVLPHTAPPQSMQNCVVPQLQVNRTSHGQERTEQGSRYARPDIYMQQLDYDQKQLHQSGQQQMALHLQQQQQLHHGQQQQYSIHSQARQTAGISSASGFGNLPTLYSSNHQFFQHFPGQVSLQGQGYTSKPTSASSNQGGNVSYSSNFKGQRQRMPIQNQQYLPRSEIQQEEISSREHLNQHHFTNPHGLISMPNQYGRPQFEPAHPLSLNTSNFNPYQTSTPMSEGHHYGARPKVPTQHQSKQLFNVTDTQPYLYGKRHQLPPTSVNIKINDPRKAVEENIVGTTSRVVQYPVYPAQPKTPILNPVINPRPITPQEGQKLDLRLDISRAQQAPEIPVLSHVQTAPVFSPPRTPKKSPDLHRTMSQVPVVYKSPSLVGVLSASPSMKDDRMSSSTSKSQFEEQDEAFRELGHTAEEALSQHSDPASRIFFTEYDDDIDEAIKGEIDDSFLENPAESLAHLLDPKQDNGITVTFRSSVNGRELSIKFFPKHTSKTWEKIIKEELDGFSRVSISDYGLQRFCLRRQDGSPIDLDGCLGNVNCAVIMVEATDNDPWWIEGGMISQ